MKLSVEQKKIWDAVVAAQAKKLCPGCAGVLGLCLFKAITSSPSDANFRTFVGMSLNAWEEKKAGCINPEMQDALNGRIW
ncbi:MAG: hypothetical protein WAV40_01555 [Microgenomates group bacterium]